MFANGLESAIEVTPVVVNIRYSVTRSSDGGAEPRGRTLAVHTLIVASSARSSWSEREARLAKIRTADGLR
jgi:hypothetical protein